MTIARRLQGAAFVLCLIASQARASAGGGADLVGEAEMALAQGQYARAYELVWSLPVPDSADDPSIRVKRHLLRAQAARQVAKFDAAEEDIRTAFKVIAAARLTGSLVDTVNFENAQLLEERGRYREAEAQYLRLLNDREKNTPRNVAGEAEVLISLGRMLQEEGRFSESVQYLNRAKSILDDRRESEPALFGEALDELADHHRQLGEYSVAERLARQGLMVREAGLGPDHPDVAWSLQGLGLLYRLQGRYSEAVQLFRRSVSIEEQAYGRDNAKGSFGLNMLGLLLYLEGRYDEAMAVHRRALEIREAAYGPKHPAIGQSLANIARVHHALGNLGAAESFFERALENRRAAFGNDNPNHQIIALTMRDFATLLADMDKNDEARRLLEGALSMDRHTFGASHKDTVSNLVALARLDLLEGNLTQAEIRARDAAQFFAGTFGKDHPRFAESRLLMARAQLAQGNVAGALASIREATAVYRLRARRSGADISRGVQQERIAARTVFMTHVKILLTLAEQDRDSRHAYISESFEVAQTAQMTSAGAALARVAARFANGDDALAGLARRRQDTVEDWRRAEDRLLALLSRPGAESTAPVRARLSELEEQIRSIDRRLKNEFPRFAQLAAPSAVALEDIQMHLDDEELMLVILVGNAETFVWALTRSEIVLNRSTLSRARLSEIVFTLRRSLDPFRIRSIEELPVFPTSEAYELYSQLFGPLASTLGKTTRVFVVPEGPLMSLPFHVLVTAPSALPESAADLRGLPWLAASHVTSVLPSVGALRSLRLFKKRSRASEPFTGFGDPDFKGAPGSSRGVRYGDVFAGDVADVEFLRRLPRLPDTADELRSIASRLGVEARALRLGSQATEGAARRSALDRYRIIAFATHGLLAGEIAGLPEPALVLSPPPNPTAEDDGLLTASEIARLHLDADWVLLSACNTAGDDGSPQGEGLSGLARAFFYAGARSLLVSHWPVHSEAAARLTMGAFDALADGEAEDPASGLHQSMRRLMSEPGRTEFAHPVFWAPFVVVGDGFQRFARF